MGVGVPDQQITVRSVDLVHHEQELVRARAQPADELLILRGGFHGVQHQEDEICLARRLQAPLRHDAVDALRAARVAARVHEGHARAAEPAFDLDGITRDPRI